MIRNQIAKIQLIAIAGRDSASDFKSEPFFIALDIMTDAVQAVVRDAIDVIRCKLFWSSENDRYVLLQVLKNSRHCVLFASPVEAICLVPGKRYLIVELQIQNRCLLIIGNLCPLIEVKRSVILKILSEEILCFGEGIVVHCSILLGHLISSTHIL